APSVPKRIYAEERFRLQDGGVVTREVVAVKAIWAGSLALAWMVATGGLHAQDTGWRPQGPGAPASAAPLVTLGKPVPLRPTNSGVVTTSFNSGSAAIVQTQATDPLAPPAV